MKKRIFALLLCLVCTLGLGGCQPEQIDYDTSPLSFETVFDDTPGNPDKPDQPEDFAFHVSHHPPAYRVRTYDFEEDTICKGAFYVLSPEDSYEIEELPPEKGIIKGVFTFDYTEQGNASLPSTIRSRATASASTASPSPMRQRTISPCATHKFMAKACSLSPSRAASLPSTCGSPGLFLLTPVVSGFRATLITTERNIPLTSVSNQHKSAGTQSRSGAFLFHKGAFSC